MSQPAALPIWDTSLTNVSASTAGHKTSGYASGEIPTSAEFNYWMNLVYTWILWLQTTVATIVRNRFPFPFSATNYAAGTAFTGFTAFGTSGAMSLGCGSTTGSAVIDLDIPSGYKLSTLTISEMASATSGTTVFTLKKVPVGNVAQTTLATLTLATTPTAATDYTMPMLLSSTGLTVTVAVPGSATYTRSSGSYLTDGFFVGQVVAWTGFANAGNNQTVTITALTATVMTCAAGTAVAETGPAAAETVTGVSPTLDGTFSIQLNVACTNAASNAQAIKDLRYTLVPQ